MLVVDAQAKFLPAQELVAGDFIGHVVPKDEVDGSNSTISCGLDLRDCEAYGVMLTATTSAFDRPGFNLAIRQDAPLRAVEWLRKYLEDANVPVSEEGGNVTFSSPFVPCGEGKVYMPLVHLPNEHLRALLRGVSMGSPQRPELSVRAASVMDAELLRYMYLRVGAFMQRNGCTLTLRHDCFRHGDFLYARVNKVQVVDHADEVCDIDVDSPEEGDRNYLTSGGLVHNGGGKRNGSFACYLEPWHGDIFDWLELKRNHGDEEARARDLFYALWVPDLFMERVEADGVWSLMCPHVCPGLSDAVGADFKRLYEGYEEEGRYIRQVKAQELWKQVLVSQIETGTPYILFKDNCNQKSNQQNLGTIKSSNLCVAPETLILTKEGHLPIESLHGREVEVWNGEEFSTTTVMKTGENQELVKVAFDNGMELRCTPYHKFHLVAGARNNRHRIVDARELTPGDRLVKCEFPTIKTGDDDFPHAYTHGFYCGDGTIGNKNDISPRPCAFKALRGARYCMRHVTHYVTGAESGAPEGRCLVLARSGMPTWHTTMSHMAWNPASREATARVL